MMLLEFVKRCIVGGVFKLVYCLCSFVVSSTVFASVPSVLFINNNDGNESPLECPMSLFSIIKSSGVSNLFCTICFWVNFLPMVTSHKRSLSFGILDAFFPSDYWMMLLLHTLNIECFATPFFWGSLCSTQFSTVRSHGLSL